MRNASFVDAFNYAGEYAVNNGLVSERGFFNPGRREGLKLAFFEAVDQVPRPIDWYVQAVSSAMGVYGTFKGAKELLGLNRIDRLPKLLCVQQSACAPMVAAYKEGSSSIKPHHVISKPYGIAEAILRGDPTRAYPHVRQIVIESGGDFVAVTEDEIREARKLITSLEKVSPCFSASAAIAGVIKKVKMGAFPLQDTVLINLTGADRKRELPQNLTWLNCDDQVWKLESEST
jgi:threonine synthase